MESGNEFCVYLFFFKANSIEFLSIKNTMFTNNIKLTLHFQDELEIHLENIIFDAKPISN